MKAQIKILKLDLRYEDDELLQECLIVDRQNTNLNCKKILVKNEQSECQADVAVPFRELSCHK